MKPSSKVTGLLIEIILSSFFFAVICAVTLQLFLQAQAVQRYSRDKSDAVMIAQSIGDIFRSEEDFETLLRLQYGPALIREGGDRYILRMDETGGRYADIRISRASAAKAGAIHSMVIEIYRRDSLLYDLEVVMYRPGELL